MIFLTIFAHFEKVRIFIFNDLFGQGLVPRDFVLDLCLIHSDLWDNLCRLI